METVGEMAMGSFLHTAQVVEVIGCGVFENQEESKRALSAYLMGKVNKR